MGKIYMIGSQKGGTAKTTTTFNLAYCLRKMGKRVLAVDFDSQANLTTCFGVEDTGVLEDTIGHLMMAQIEDEKMPSPKRYIRTKDGVDFIPSSIYLSVVDAKLRPEMGAEQMLSGILEPLRGTVVKIRKRINPGLGIAGILMTMCESRTKLCKVLTEEVLESFQEQIRVFETRIPSTVKVGESIYYSLPVAEYSL